MFNHQIEQLNNLFTMIFSNIQFKLIWSSILGLFTFFTGCEEKILTALIILIAIDTLFGFCVAFKRKRLASYNFFGLLFFKLFLYLSLMIMSYQAITFATGNWLLIALEISRDLVMLGIAVTEVISTLESATLLGFKWARKIIDKINDSVEDKLRK